MPPRTSARNPATVQRTSPRSPATVGGATTARRASTPNASTTTNTTTGGPPSATAARRRQSSPHVSASPTSPPATTTSSRSATSGGTGVVRRNASPIAPQSATRTTTNTTRTSSSSSLRRSSPASSPRGPAPAATTGSRRSSVNPANRSQSPRTPMTTRQRDQQDALRGATSRNTTSSASPKSPRGAQKSPRAQTPASAQSPRAQSPRAQSPSHSPRLSPQMSPRHSPSASRQGSRSPSASTGVSPLEGEDGLPPAATPKEDPEEEERKRAEEEAERAEKERLALEEELKEKKAHAADLDAKIKLINDHQHSINANERADQFKEKAAPLMVENKKMRKEIQHLRNFDRVLVNLREQLQTMNKHVRLRNANIRQKDATIQIIQRRIVEQGEASWSLLDTLLDDSNLVAWTAEELQQRSEMADRVKPTSSMAPLVYQFAEREEMLEKHLADVAKKEAESQKATEELVRLQRELVFDSEAMTVEKEKEIARRTAEWAKEKDGMLKNYSQLVVEARNTAFHVRRGTNIKMWEQLPHPSTYSDQTQNRDLTLTVHENETAIELMHKDIEDLKARLGNVEEAHANQLTQVEHSLKAAQKETKSTSGRQKELQKQLRRLKGEETTDETESEGNSPSSNLNSRRHKSQLMIMIPDENGLEDEDDSFARTRSGEPPRFTSATMRRLLNPTKAYQARLDVEEVDREERAKQITSVRRHRPHGVSV